MRILLERIRKIWNPAIYQGKMNMKGYFEGWYFKIVDESEENIYAIIPGISFGKDGTAHAFIQFFDGKAAKMKYFEYDQNQFRAKQDHFEVRIGKNVFNSEGLELDIEQGEDKIKGKLAFGQIIGWPVKFFSPGAMGWYRFVPRMECYHGVISFDHELKGKLAINGKKVDFTGGRGYIEKDYGRSFPSYYLWGQTNHFDETGVSLMVSFAKIPWLGSYFDGFIIGVLQGDNLYRFATYTGAKIMKLKLDDKKVIIHVEDRKHKLEMEAIRTAEVQLASPIEGSMTGRILESITAKINVKLIEYKKKEERILFEGQGRNAGLDIGGKINEIPTIE